MGQLYIALVEDLLFLLIQFVPDVRGCLDRYDVGGPAKVPWLNDAHLQVGSV